MKFEGDNPAHMKRSAAQNAKVLNMETLPWGNTQGLQVSEGTVVDMCLDSKP